MVVIPLPDRCVAPIEGLFPSRQGPPLPCVFFVFQKIKEQKERATVLYSIDPSVSIMLLVVSLPTN